MAQAIKNEHFNGSVGLPDISQITEFEYLLESFIEWVQSQNGLKPRDKSIGTYHELLTAYRLLGRCGTTEHAGSTLDLALTAESTYAYNISRSKLKLKEAKRNKQNKS